MSLPPSPPHHGCAARAACSCSVADIHAHLSLVAIYLLLVPTGTLSNLPTLLGLAAPDGLDASSKVRKVVQNWKLKKVFDDLTISVAQATAGPHAAKLLAEHQPAQQTDATATVAVAPAVAVTEASPAADQDFPARVVALFDLKSGRPGELVLVAGVEYGVTAKLDANWCDRCLSPVVSSGA